jgi:phosphate:Na+ symporter
VTSMVLGGVGIFLIGMILLTEGLKAAAGGALRSILARFTRGPGSAFLSGAGVTALVQSSSATTLTTIGFVSAGLLTFPQAVGVLLGANVGTTSTGWLVSVLGLKVQVSLVALPAVGVGALMRLLGRGRSAHWGMALAGFGLIFVGIDLLQAGMEGVAERFDPASFPGLTLPGRVALVAIGAGMTVVMQSSSAAVATTLTALHAGTIGLEQAALLVVGQNVGTTVKAALASLGASVPARRTAVAHILFNVGTGALALLVLPVLLPFTLRVAGAGDPAVAIALFHTAFNLLGVAVVFPVLGPFCRLVERLVPEREPSLVRYLDRSVLEVPPVAVEAARRSAVAVAEELFRRCRGRLPGAPGPPIRGGPGDLDSLVPALDRIREFLGQVRTTPDQGPDHLRHLSLLHALDHLDRFRSALEGLTAEARGMREGGGAEATVLKLAGELGASLEGRDPDALGPLSERIADLRRSDRARILEDTAAGSISPDRARGLIEFLKTQDRLAYHAWRAAHHLRAADPEEEARAVGESPFPGAEENPRV